MFRQKALILGLVMGSISTPVLASEELVGLWGRDGCAQFDTYEFQGQSSAAYVTDQGINVIPQLIDEVRRSDWYFLRIDDEDTAPVLMKRDGRELVQAWPQEQPGSPEETSALHSALASGALSPDDDPEKFELIPLGRCESLPFPQSLAFGETLAVLEDLDRAVAVCRSEPEDCATALFEVADLTDDGELTLAEMARTIRASFAIAGAMDLDGDVSQKAGTAAASAVLAPLASAAFLHSFDYDRSGALSFDELLEERLPSDYAGASELDIDVSDWVEAISGASRAAAGAGSMMLP